MMDKTELYIKMSDCPEVQNHRKPKIEKMKDGRWHYEWELEDGDFFATRNLFETRDLYEIEVKGTTIYDPYFYNTRKDANIDISTVGFDEGDGYVTKKFIWLPTQSQIQKMMIKERFGDFGAHWNMCIDIPIQFVAKNPKLELFSMEQIWLSCYMLSIHHKTWNGEKWVKK